VSLTTWVFVGVLSPLDRWNTVTAIVLLNVLISLFSSAYSDVVDDAEAQYLAFFASKTVEMIRAPDSYVYPAPFNLIEAIFVAPLEFVPLAKLSSAHYAQLNRFVMGTIFLNPLAKIAFYESTFDRRKHKWMNAWFRGNDEGEEDRPEYRDPNVDDPACDGLVISKIPFEELIKVFPNTSQSSEATILKELNEIKQQLSDIQRALGHRWMGDHLHVMLSTNLGQIMYIQDILIRWVLFYKAVMIHWTGITDPLLDCEPIESEHS